MTRIQKYYLLGAVASLPLMLLTINSTLPFIEAFFLGTTFQIVATLAGYQLGLREKKSNAPTN